MFGEVPLKEDMPPEEKDARSMHMKWRHALLSKKRQPAAVGAFFRGGLILGGLGSCIDDEADGFQQLMHRIGFLQERIVVDLDHFGL